MAILPLRNMCRAPKALFRLSFSNYLKQRMKPVHIHNSLHHQSHQVISKYFVSEYTQKGIINKKGNFGKKGTYSNYRVVRNSFLIY